MLTRQIPFPQGDGSVTASVFHNGVLYVCGFFRNVAGVPRHGLMAINPKTLEVLPWDPDINISFTTIDAIIGVGNKIIIGGKGITSVNGGATVVDNLFAVDEVVGTFDAGFGAPALLTAKVNSLTTDGTLVYAGGDFTTIGATPRGRGAAFDVATGALSPWNPDLNSTVTVVHYDALTSAVYVGGLFSVANVGTTADVRVGGASFTATGGADTGTTLPWNPSTSAAIDAIAVSGTDVYIGGPFATVNTSTVPVFRLFVAKVNNAAGTIDPAFALNTFSPVTALVIDSGQLYVGTTGGSIGFDIVPATTDHQAFARVSLMGIVDDTLRIDVNGSVNTITVFGGSPSDISSSIYLGGFLSAYMPTVYRDNLAIYLKNGNIKSGITPAANAEATGISIDSVGRIAYVSGKFTKLTGPNGSFVRNGLGAFNIDTGNILPWAPQLNTLTNPKLKFDSVSGNIFVIGDFTQVGPTGFAPSIARSRAASFDSAGNVLSWDPNLTGGIAGVVTRGLLVTATDVYIGGTFLTVNGATSRDFLAKFDKVSGTVDAGWDAAVILDASNSAVNAITLNPAGTKLYIGGEFSGIGGGGQNDIARIDIVTALDDGWTPTIDDPTAVVFSVAVKNNDVRVIGVFTAVEGGTLRDALAIWDDAGVLDSFNLDPNSSGLNIAHSMTDRWIMQSFGTIFTQTVQMHGFVLLSNANVVLNTDPGLNGVVEDIDDDGECFYIVGSFQRALMDFANTLGGSVIFQAQVTGIPELPKIQLLHRKKNTTLFKWQRVHRDQEQKSIEVTSYNIFRSTNRNLETFQLIKTIFLKDTKGFVDSFFTEEIDGYFGYGVTAVSAVGEGPMATASAVQSSNDLDLLS